MAWKTSTDAGNRQQNELNMWLAAVVVGILIVVIMVACFGLFRKLQDNKRQIADLNEQIRTEEQRADDIEEFRQYTETREYIEEIAREKLGLAYGGGAIFKEEPAKSELPRCGGSLTTRRCSLRAPGWRSAYE